MAEWFWYFLIYSFVGFVLEILFARITRCPKRDRKCFYFLPLCPVYGLGALLILALSPYLLERPLLLALGAAAAATAAEYLMALFYEKALRVSFWNYSALPLNIQGRVCLLFSLFWCVLGLGLVYGVHPLVADLTGRIPAGWTLPSALFLALDSGFTIYVLRREGSTEALRWYRRLGQRGGARERV